MAYKQPVIENISAGYNQGMLTTIRLDKLTTAYSGSMINKEFETAYESLNLIFDEIFPKLKEEERETVYRYREEVKSPLRKWVFKSSTFGSSMKKGSSGLKYKLLDECRAALDNYSKVLRLFMDMHGYGMPTSDDPNLAAYG